MEKIELFCKHDDEFRDTAEIWIEGSVDGFKSHFILDTGCATTSLFYNEFAAKYPSFGVGEYSSAIGSATCDTIFVCQIGSGPIQKKDMAIVKTSKGSSNTNYFGMDLLKDSIFQFRPF